MSSDGFLDREKFTFAQLVAGREDDFPILARAAANTQPAHDVRIYWTQPEGVVWDNYQQIFRNPYTKAHPECSDFTGGHVKADDALLAFLAGVESMLEHGKPHHEQGTYLRWCGGYRHYLGRDLHDDDTLILRPLREPERWTHWFGMTQNGPEPLDTPRYEWLAETSLQVVPGDTSAVREETPTPPSAREATVSATATA